MYAKKVAILRKHDMLLELISPNFSQFSKVLGCSDAVDEFASWVLRLLVRRTAVHEVLEDRPGALVKPVDHGFGENQGYNKADSKFDGEKEETEDDCVVFGK